MQVTAPPTTGLVPVRNMQSGPTLFKDEQQNFVVTWAGAGDPHGQDVQLIPEHYLLNNPQMVKVISRGTLVRADQEVTATADQAAAAHTPGIDLSTQAAESTQRVDDKDLIGVGCIAPGSRQGVTCDAQTLVPSRNSDVPPLCSQHQSLAPSCVPYTAEDNEIRWTVATMGQRTTDTPAI